MGLAQRLARRDILGSKFRVGDEEPSWSQWPPVDVEDICKARTLVSVYVVPWMEHGNRGRETIRLTTQLVLLPDIV
jgi:hypothetical protein